MNPSPKEGVGNAGCPLHPQPRVRFALVKSTRVNEYTGITRRSRTQWFYDLFRALPGDRALLPPSPADMVLSKPGRADLTSANLTPASGRQDHTTSPYATTSLVRSLCDRSQAVKPALRSRRAQNAAASTASNPASVTIAIRPSSGVDESGLKVFLPGGKGKNFSNRGWTLICPTGCFARKRPSCGQRLPSSVIDLHPQSSDIDFVAAKM
jgi:hypothetical protein